MSLFACGGNFTLVVTDTDIGNRVVLACGINNYGQLGNGQLNNDSNTLQPVI